MAPLFSCSECGYEIEQDARRCPQCKSLNPQVAGVCSLCQLIFEYDEMSSLHTKPKICSACTSMIKKVKYHCPDCQAPVKIPSTRCSECDCRLKATECICCGHGLFKHDAVRLHLQRNTSAKGIWPFNNDLYKDIDVVKFMHRVCAEKRPDLLAKAHKFEFIEPTSKKSSRRRKSRKRTLAKSSNAVEFKLRPHQGRYIREARDFSAKNHNSSQKSRVPLISPTAVISSQENIIALLKRYLHGERDFQRSDFKGADLQAAKLPDIRLNHSMLSGINFRFSDLKGAKLIGSDLQDADFCQASLSKANLTAAVLSRVNARGVKMWLVQLTQADLSQADMESADLCEANLEAANLEGANLASVKFEEANLENAILRNANLAQANLSRANMEGADLRGANFEIAHLEEANLKGTQLAKANFEGSTLAMAHLENASYDIETRFPAGFDPASRGMLLESTEVLDRWRA